MGMKARCSSWYNWPAAINEQGVTGTDKIPVFVGLDYHQSSVQVCVMEREGRVLANQSCANDWKAIQEKAESKGRVVRAALESCSGAADLADELVQHAGWSVHLAHSGYVTRMKQNPDKTDYTDAQMLADLERVGYLPRVWLAPQQIRELRLLVRHRQQMVNQRRSTKLRIRAVLREQRIGNAPYNPWTMAWLDWLKHSDRLSDQGRKGASSPSENGSAYLDLPFFRFLLPNFDRLLCVGDTPE